MLQVFGADCLGLPPLFRRNLW